MGKKIGLWIDHRKAIIVAVTEKGEETQVIQSKVDSQPRRTGDSPLAGPHEAQSVPADDSRQNSLTGHLDAYYDSVIAHIKDAESILIFGPGEAKDELKKRLGEKKLSARVEKVEPADKMTDKQISAKVREHFA
jgi:hypothetical protein